MGAGGMSLDPLFGRLRRFFRAFFGRLRFIGQAAGDDHFGLVAAFFTFTNLSYFFFGHLVLLVV
jgi:hypothetical protein